MLGNLRAVSSRTSNTAAPVLSRAFHTPQNVQDWMQFPTEMTKLPNGIRVVTQKTHDDTASVGLFVNSGSRNEAPQSNGVAHFLEHMIFKGTDKRSRVQLEQEIENMGAHLNAYTTRENTVFVGKVFKNDVKNMINILGDVLQNSKFSKDAIEQERHVILAEKEFVEKDNRELILDKLHASAFYEQSLGNDILGSEQNILTIQKEDIEKYIQENYTTDRLVVVATGAVDHREIVQHAESILTKFQPRRSGILLPNGGQDKPYFCGKEWNYRRDDIPIASMAVAWEGVPWDHPEAPVFMVMQQILGEFERNTSVFPDNLVGNKAAHSLNNKMGVGAAEKYFAFNTHYSDTGLFGYYAECEETAVEHVQGDLMFYTVSLAYNTTEEEVYRAKLKLKAQLFGTLDNNTALFEDIGRNILNYGRRVSPAEFMRRIDAVDAEEVKRVAWNKIHDNEIAVAAYGPTYALTPLSDLRRKTFWIRY